MRSVRRPGKFGNVKILKPYIIVFGFLSGAIFIIHIIMIVGVLCCDMVLQYMKIMVLAGMNHSAMLVIYSYPVAMGKFHRVNLKGGE